MPTGLYPKRRRQRANKKKKAASVSRRRRNTYSALSKRLDKVAKLAIRSNLYRTSFKQGTVSVDGNQAVSAVGLCIPQTMRMLLGPNHNTLMSSLAFSIEKFYLHGISVRVRAISWDQPKPTNFMIGLITPSRNGNMRDTTGSAWVLGEDYFQDPTGKFLINKTYWKVHTSKQFQLTHFERLNSAPATNSNQPPPYTEKHMKFYIKFKSPMRYVKGDKTDVWDLVEDDLPYYKKYLLVILQDNPDTAAGNTQQVAYMIKNYVEMPN